MMHELVWGPPGRSYWAEDSVWDGYSWGDAQAVSFAKRQRPARSERSARLSQPREAEMLAQSQQALRMWPNDVNPFRMQW